MEDNILPQDVKDQINEMEGFLTDLERVVSNAMNVKSTQELAPLQEAQLNLLLARAGQALYDIYMNSLGKESDAQINHQRLKAYLKKVQQVEYRLESTQEEQNLKLDIEAASRFIEHALPELTQEQKDNFKNVRSQAQEKRLEDQAVKFMEEELE
eukprot:TRINITY_DN4852_c0_g1_i1.p1 TRINITY_DN4852_c0_g1~~TRINITY_DN4852_c0_g1_i1.p1  ORF type:complete len:155 (+),score=29.19 TRINITY_DN4852_c0_g1_i1:46-510(+)